MESDAYLWTVAVGAKVFLTVFERPPLVIAHQSLDAQA